MRATFLCEGVENAERRSKTIDSNYTTRKAVKCEGVREKQNKRNNVNIEEYEKGNQIYYI